MPASVPAKRVWRRIQEMERLKLKKTVGLGLPTYLAANILKINARNANRVMFKMQQTKHLETVPIFNMSKEQRDEITLANKDLEQ